MICYRDMTFCAFWEECRGGMECPRALTFGVRLEAERWWLPRVDGAPICVYTHKPECFKGE